MNCIKVCRICSPPTKSSSQVYQCHLGKGAWQGHPVCQTGAGARFVISREFANFFASPLMSHRPSDLGRPGEGGWPQIHHNLPHGCFWVRPLIPSHYSGSPTHLLLGHLWQLGNLTTFTNIPHHAPPNRGGGKYPYLPRVLAFAKY